MKHGGGMKSVLSRVEERTLGCLSEGNTDCRNGWGATIVDGLDTLIIAGLYDQLYRALNYTVSIDFSNPDGLVDPFETIIRWPLLSDSLTPGT